MRMSIAMQSSSCVVDQGRMISLSREVCGARWNTTRESSLRSAIHCAATVSIICLLLAPTVSAFLGFATTPLSPPCFLESSSRFTHTCRQFNDADELRHDRRGWHALQMSSVADATWTRGSNDQGGSSNFANRMRNLVADQRTVSKKIGTIQQERMPTPTKSVKPPNVHLVSTLEEYKIVIGEEKNKVVVVRFFATWCKACKAIAPLFYRTAKNNPNVVFVEVPVTDKNSNLHQGLSVPSLPYGHIYVPSIGLVEEMKINRKYYKQFEEALRRHVRGSCELRDDDCSFPFVIQEGEHVDTFQ